jgi:hypothetical protein
MKPIGYTNPGGDESKPVKVYKLTKQQTLFKARVQEVADRVKDLKKKLDTSEKTLEHLQETCTHKVFTYSPGFDWTFQYCYLCGAYICAG